MINSNLKVLLDEQDWESLIIKLTAYTIQKLKHIKLSKAFEAEDFVLEAIKRVYTGERNWEPEKIPDICYYLSRVINSIIYAEREKSSSKNFVDKEREERIDIKETVESDNPSAEEEQKAKELDIVIRKNIKGDEILEFIYESLIVGLKPKDIANDFDLEIEEVRNNQKRLRRIVNKIINKNN